MKPTDNQSDAAASLAGDSGAFESTNPATGEVNWRGRAAGERETIAAGQSARAAFAGWASTALADRIAVLQALAEKYRAMRPILAEAIARETGKPRWEALAEVDSMIGKIPISIEAQADRCRRQSKESGGVIASAHFRPHGVLAVLGPFNMPGHLPNGHIIPALLAGNTLVFKPSERTPLVGQRMIEAAQAAGLPAGILNLVQGGPATAMALARDPNIDGILFTGSTGAGIALRRALTERPEKILALEMGGNNPLIFHDAADLNAAGYLILQSAYITAGQRCSCARRLIVPRGAAGDALLKTLANMVRKVRIGFWDDDPPAFMGTVISKEAARDLLAAQKERLNAGAVSLVEMRQSPRSAALLSPGLLDVTAQANRPDVEIFGPLLQVIRVEDFGAGMAEANRTAFGLTAGLISERAEVQQKFFAEIRAGVLSVNRPMTGASSALPFGGIGRSGNHRPGGYLAADYCAYAVASLSSGQVQLPAQLPPGIQDGG